MLLRVLAICTALSALPELIKPDKIWIADSPDQMLSRIDVSQWQLDWMTTRALGKAWAMPRVKVMDSTNAGASEKGYMVNGVARVEEGEDRTGLVWREWVNCWDGPLYILPHGVVTWLCWFQAPINKAMWLDASMREKYHWQQNTVQMTWHDKSCDNITKNGNHVLYHRAML